MNNFNKRMKFILEVLDVKQGPFAQKIGTTQSTVSKWLNTENNRPTVENLEEMVKVYSINVSWLLTGIGYHFINKKNNYEILTLEEPSENYNTELQKALKQLADCREETLQLYRQIHNKKLLKS